LKGSFFLDTHPNFKQLKAHGTTFTVDKTNACINESIVSTVKNYYGAVWIGEEEHQTSRVREDSTHGNAASEGCFFLQKKILIFIRNR
jgi:hypothetical protein